MKKETHIDDRPAPTECWERRGGCHCRCRQWLDGFRFCRRVEELERSGLAGSEEDSEALYLGFE